MAECRNHLRWWAVAGLAAWSAAAPAAHGQQPAPRIGYVYPAGGRAGSTFRAVVGGQRLQDVGDVYVSCPGVTATVIEHTRPLTPKEFTLLRDKLKELQDKKAAATQQSGPGRPRNATRPAWTDDDEKTLAEIKKKLANPPNRQANPAIAETVTIEVTVARDAELGEADLRLRTPAGLTNPLVFCVGRLPEFSEEEVPDKGGPVGGKAAEFPRPQRKPAVDPVTEITLPAVVNGQIMPGDVDRFRFQARKGEGLVVAVAARELIPYLADAVPGWFQAVLTLYDAQGRELAYDDDYRFDPDPALFYRVPRDGEYRIEIRDAIYRGREDFVYRITVGRLPFVTSVFPLGGQAGAETVVEVKGWNLPSARLTQNAADVEAGITQLSAYKGSTFTNRVPFALETLPESVEKEPNNEPDRAQSVTPPTIVNGRSDRPGDWDVFGFEGRAGQKVVAEVYARRLGSPMDSVLKLTDADGRQLAINDDHEDKGAGLITHHADSWLQAKLPADGTYHVYVGDTQEKGGPEYAYRLRIGPPRPDFELRVVPSSINVRRGGSATLTVYALRKDGFNGEISVALKDAPPGFRLAGGRVPAGQDQAKLTLTVPPASLDEPVSLGLEGRATIEEQAVVRPAVPAEDMMQAFAYRHLVPAKQLLVAVSGRRMPRNGVR
ncbi:MAG: peptidase [Planctomycetes bacterium]|nr:peptidase [Planctomycetota bacterium]